MKNSRFRLPIRAWLLYLFVCLFAASGVTLARFTAASSAGDSAAVAAFIVSSSGSADTALSLDPYAAEPITEASYPFEITNFSGPASAPTAQTEVAFDYTLTVTLPQELPAGLSMRLGFVNAGNTVTEIAGTTVDSITYTFASPAPAEGTTPLMHMPAAEATTHSYTLTFAVKDGATNEDMSKIAGLSWANNITISVTAEQTD